MRCWTWVQRCHEGPYPPRVWTYGLAPHSGSRHASLVDAQGGSRDFRRGGEYHRVDIVYGSSPWPEALAPLPLAARGLGRGASGLLAGSAALRFPRSTGASEAADV